MRNLSQNRIEREKQWGSQVKGSSLFQNISKGMEAFGRGVLLSSIHRWAGTSYLPELNKGTLVYSQAEGQGRSGKPLNTIIIIKASQKKFPTWSQNWLPPCKITFTQFSEIILCLQCFLLFFFLINNQLNRHILGRNFAFPHISQCEIFKAFLQPIA